MLVVVLGSMRGVAQTPCENGFAGIYPCDSVDLLGHMTSAEMGVPSGTDLNDIWGWTDPRTKWKSAEASCFSR